MNLLEVCIFSKDETFILVSFIFLEMSIIMVGDFRQLPPVGGRALYSNPVSASEIHGKALFDMFKDTVILDENMRQNQYSDDLREGKFIHK